MLNSYHSYYENNDHSQVKEVQIFPIGQSRTKSISVSIKQHSTFNSLIQILEERLFKDICQLRLFNSTGVELFEPDLRFLKNKEILYASSNGEEFDSVSSFQEYEILKVLGEGGFGKVMLGEHKITHERVAIKILNTAMVGNAEDIDMVFREAQLLQSLNHQNIVKIIKCFTLSNMQVVFIMEYLEGGELLSLLQKKGKLTEDEAKLFVRQIVEAINYCHNQNLIHRDLKLENILLEQKNSSKIKIVDFGISGLSTFQIDKATAGSLMYMPPEIFTQNLKNIGPPIDVWAIGIIIFALVTGHLPYNGITTNEIIDSICLSNPIYPQGLSHLLKHLLSKIFVANPLKRIKLIDILRHPWLEQPILEYSLQGQELLKNESFLNTKNAQQTQVKFGMGLPSLRKSILKQTGISKINRDRSPDINISGGVHFEDEEYLKIKQGYYQQLKINQQGIKKSNKQKLQNLIKGLNYSEEEYSGIYPMTDRQGKKSSEKQTGKRNQSSSPIYKYKNPKINSKLPSIDHQIYYNSLNDSEKSKEKINTSKVLDVDYYGQKDYQSQSRLPKINVNRKK